MSLNTKESCQPCQPCIVLDARAVAQVVSRRLPTAAARVRDQGKSSLVSVVARAALAQVSFQYFRFPCRELGTKFMAYFCCYIVWLRLSDIDFVEGCMCNYHLQRSYGILKRLRKTLACSWNSQIVAEMARATDANHAKAFCVNVMNWNASCVTQYIFSLEQNCCLSCDRVVWFGFWLCMRLTAWLFVTSVFYPEAAWTLGVRKIEIQIISIQIWCMMKLRRGWILVMLANIQSRTLCLLIFCLKTEKLEYKWAHFCKNWGFHGGGYEEWLLLGCYAMGLLQEPTFRRNLAPPSWRWQESVN
jgi:hypothetical protein